MISQETIDAVKDLSIVEAIGKYVDLKKSGAHIYRAKSPFSGEKTPSFYVVENKGFFKDFSSGKGGDHIKFVIEKLGLSYIDAIKELCQQFGIEVKYEKISHPPEYYDHIKLLEKINHASANKYAEQLQQIFAWPSEQTTVAAWQRDVFNELIERRRFTHDTILQWQIGYAPGDTGEGFTPDKWNFLSQILVAKGYYEAGCELGLIITKDQKNYDAFRNRIIFPVIDHNGKYVGFGGRSLNPDTFNPKYLNSADSAENSPQLFNKGKVLYGLHYAGKAIREKGFTNITEGYTDVISFHQAGLNNTVGTCGTALTGDQAKLLRKYTNKAVLFYDGDEAGQNATMRAIDILMAYGFTTSVVPMPTRLQLKDYHFIKGNIIEVKPSIPEDSPLAFNDYVFITQRDKETMMVKYGSDIIPVPYDAVAQQAKIDPDELVRMFQ